MNVGLASILSVLLLVQIASAQKNSDFDRIGRRNINKDRDAMSLKDELRAGDNARAEFEQTERLVDQPDIRAFLNRLSQHIAGNSDAKIPVNAKLVESDDANAYTIAGGTFYITTGLLRYVDSEAELAYVIANCIAHVAARHPVLALPGVTGRLKMYTRTNVFMPVSSESQDILIGGSPTMVSSLQSYYREQVTEADFLGLEYLYKSGYDLDAAIQLLEKMDKQSIKQDSTIVSIYPTTTERIKSQQKEFGIFPARDQYVVTTSEFDRIKQLLPPQ